MSSDNSPESPDFAVRNTDDEVEGHRAAREGSPDFAAREGSPDFRTAGQPGLRNSDDDDTEGHVRSFNTPDMARKTDDDADGQPGIR